MEIEALKFGGSILKDQADFERAADIISKEIQESRLPICVVSAMKGITDKIIYATKKAHRDDDFDPQQFLKKLYQNHKALLPTEDSSKLSEEFEKLKHVLMYIKYSSELSDSTYAFAVSRGENFSSRILSAYLTSRKIDNRCYYGENLIVTDDKPRDASVNLKKTVEKVEELLMPCIKNEKVPIIAGFAGRSEKGRITVLGRGGADDTAACIAYCLGIDRVVKYVDEEGIMTIDPKFLEDLKENRPEIYNKLPKLSRPRVIPYLSYVEASELLREERTKIVHYKVLNPLMKGNIKLLIKNVSKPDVTGTIIGPENELNQKTYGRPKAISFQRNLSGIRFMPSQSMTPIEVYSKVFEVLAREGVDVRYLSTSGYQISLLMTKNDVNRALKALKSLNIGMNVTPLEGLKGTFSIIGSGMRGVRGLFSKITGTIAKHGVNIEQAIQPYSENIIRFSVEDEELPLAVSALYSEFFN